MIRRTCHSCEPIVLYPHLPATLSRLFSGKVARGSSISLGIKIAALGLAFLQAVLIARLLGPKGYGAISVALSVAALLATLTTLGLGRLAVREIPRALVGQSWGVLRGLVLSTLICVGVVATLAGCGIALAAARGYIGSDTYRMELILGGVLTPLIALLAVTTGIFQGFGRVAAAQMPSEILSPLLKVAGIIALLALAVPASPSMVMVLILCATAFSLAVAAGLLRHHLGVAVPSKGMEICASTWLRGGAPFLMVTFLGVALNEINTLLLGWLANPIETGLFQPLLRISSVMLIGLSAVLTAFAPRAAELHARGNRSGLASIARKATIATTLVTAIVCGAILFIAPQLLAVFGRAFAANASSLVWVAAAQLINTGCGPVGTLLTMTGHIRSLIKAQITGLAINLLLGLWLIPTYGAHGAVLAMCGGIVAWNILALVSVWRLLGFDPSLVSATIAAFREITD